LFVKNKFENTSILCKEISNIFEISLPVIPILFHHGPSKEVLSEFSQLFEPLVDPAFLPYIPKFTVGLMNVTVLGEEDFPPDPKLSLALWGFKYAKTQAKKVVQKIAVISEEISKVFEISSHNYGVFTNLF